MREIRFRGLSEKDNKWVFGDIFYGITYISINVTEKFDNYNSIKHVVVKPETVGQYIGIKDKGGREICEGDILKDLGFVEYESESIPYEMNSARFVINIMGEKNEVHFNELKTEDLEVIGNIYENPELLKGDDLN